MANINFDGLDELRLSMQEVAELPDEVIDEMLDAGANIVVAAQKRKIREMGLVDTGKLQNSIRAFSKLDKYRQKYRLVYPYGKHGEYHRKQKTKVYANSKHGRTYTVGGDVKTVTNNEVGYILEYGAPQKGIHARGWMKEANEQCAAETTAAQAAVYDRYLKSKNL